MLGMPLSELVNRDHPLAAARAGLGARGGVDHGAFGFRVGLQPQALEIFSYQLQTFIGNIQCQ